MPCDVGGSGVGKQMNRMPERAHAASPNPCPICGKPAAEKFRPFCGKRCADVDLNRWLSNVYVVPASAADADEDEKPSATPADEEP